MYSLDNYLFCKKWIIVIVYKMPTTPSQNLISAIFQPQPGFYESLPVNDNENTYTAMPSTTYFNTIPGTATIQPNNEPFKLNIINGVPDNYSFTITCTISAYQNTLNTLNKSNIVATPNNIPEGNFVMYLSYYSSFSYIQPSPSDSYLIQIGSWKSDGNSTLTSNQIIYNSQSKTYYTPNDNNSMSILQNVFGDDSFYVGLYFEPTKPTVYAVGNTQSNYTNPHVTITQINDLMTTFPPQPSQLVNTAFYSLITQNNSVDIPQVLTNANSMGIYLNQLFSNSPAYFSAIQNKIQNVLTIYNISELDVVNIQLPVAPSGYIWFTSNVVMFFILPDNSINTGVINNNGYAVIPTYVNNNSGLKLYDELTNFFLQLILMNQQNTNNMSFTPFNISASLKPDNISTIGAQIDTILKQPYININPANNKSYSASYNSNKFFNITLRLQSLM